MNINKSLLITAGALTATGASVLAAAEQPRPNILFILVDDLGLGDLSCQYATDVQTPNIDRIFETGLRLDNFYSNSTVSSPSRAALLTGCFPALVGVPGVIRTNPEESWGYLSHRAITMPQILSEAGYSTALIGKWHLGLESPNLPNERGFHHFRGFHGDMMDDYYTHKRQGNDYMYHNDRLIFPEGHATDIFSDWTIEYLNSRTDQSDPFFLYLAYNAPHIPLQPPTDWLEKVTSRQPGLPETRAKLVALIEHLDHNIGRIMETLKKNGQLQNTLIVFTSDNGGDRGAMANNGPVRGAKGDMYEGGIKVACALNLPGVFEGGQRCDQLIMMMDFLPTFCDMLGLESPADINGISVADALSGKNQDTENRYLFWLRTEGWQFGGRSQSIVRYEGYKLLQNTPFVEPEMFFLRDDPTEAEPLETEGGIFERLSQAMTSHYRQWYSVPSQAPVDNVPIR